MHLIYIGNKLYKQKGIMSVMETLIEQFESFALVASASNKKSTVFKIADITKILLKNLRKADYVMIDVFSTKAFYFACWVSFISILFRKKYILNLHGGNLPDRYLRSPKLFKYILHKAHKITAPSGYLKEYFTKQGFSVELIPNPINLADYPITTTHLDFPVILYLRGYGNIYQPELLIHAMTHIRNKFPHAHLYMFGNDLDGGLEKCLDIIHTHNLQDNITISGPVSKSVWIETAKKCNVCISVPKIDNTPVSVLEAMAMGIPVISSHVGGMKWIIEDNVNGIFTDQTPQDISENINGLFSNLQFYQRIRQNGLDYVKNYDVNTVVKYWQSILTAHTDMT